MAQIQKSTEFGVYHLADQSVFGEAYYQPLRTNNFRFIIDDTKFGNLLRLNGDSQVADDYFKNGQEVIDFSVVKFDVPHFKQDVIQVQRGNSTIKYASKASWADKSLVINDFAGDIAKGNNGKSILEAWQALSYDPVNDTVATSDKYKMHCQVLEYLPDNTLVRYWELEGCWISSLDETGWDNESSSKKTVTAVITYDRAIPRSGSDL